MFQKPLTAAVVAVTVTATLARADVLRVPSEYSTIQDAVVAASPLDEVVVAPGVYEVTEPIVFHGKAVVVRSSEGPERTTVRMTTPVDGRRGSVFSFQDEEPEGVVVEGFTISGGRGTLVDHVAAQRLYRLWAGGAVYCGPYSAPVLRGNVFRDNSAGVGGGVFCDVDSYVRLEANRFVANTAHAIGDLSGRGGALAVLEDSEVRIAGDFFEENEGLSGGAIHVVGGALEILDATFSDNVAIHEAYSSGGGAVYYEDAAGVSDGLVVRRSTFRRNQTTSRGGAIRLLANDFEIENSQFERNQAGIGGGLFVDVSRLPDAGERVAVVRGSTFESNHADLDGGGAATEEEIQEIRFEACDFVGNTAREGGGLFLAYEARTTLFRCEVARNYAMEGGGAYLDESETTIDGCILRDNVATARGGALHLSGAHVTCRRSTVSGNAAGIGGGVFSYGSQELRIESSIVWGNAGGSLVEGFDRWPHPPGWTVSYSLIEGDTVPAGEGNINSSPRFVGWGTRGEVFVDELAPEAGDGSRARPFRKLEDALSSYDLALSNASPCLGSGPAGIDMGADTGHGGDAGSENRTVRLAGGRYELGDFPLAHDVSISGSGAMATVIVGTVTGLRTGAELARVQVREGTDGAVVASSIESPRIAECLLTACVGELAGGVTVWPDASPVIDHTTISGNAGMRAGGAAFVPPASTNDPAPPAGEISSSIVWGNAGGSFDITTVGPQVSFSCVERAGNPIPGEGNILADPLFTAWGNQDEVFVDEAAPGPGDGTEGSPFRALKDAVSGFSFVLASQSPCRGKGERGTDMGPPFTPTAPAGAAARLVHVAEGTYAVGVLHLAGRVSISGAGPGATVIEGAVVGLRSGSLMEDVTVTASPVGGVAIASGESPRIARCEVTENASIHGGGIRCSGCEATIEDCSINRNRAVLEGGGLYVEGGSSLRLERCRIAQNSARDGGGVSARAAYLEHLAELDIVSCVLEGNEAEWGGGGLAAQDARVSIVSSLLAGNVAAWGSAWSIQELGTDDGFVSVESSTITKHDTNAQAYAISCGNVPLRFSNSIYWKNGTRPLCRHTEITHSLMTVDPLFREEGTYDPTLYDRVEVAGRFRRIPDTIDVAGDYRLRPNSPAIDAGMLQSAPAFDLIGTLRPCGEATDIGAYEEGACDALFFLRGDVDASGELELSDGITTLEYLYSGGDAPSCEKAIDVDDSGELDITDPIVLFRYLYRGGPPPPAPLTRCGFDRTADLLTCADYPWCAPTP